MKILLVNKFHYVVGGSETYYFALKKLLEQKGHSVVEFSMKHPDNLPSEYEDYFVDNIDYHGYISFPEKVRQAGHIIYSREARDKMQRLVDDTKPDLVHLNLFQHQLSPSILDVCKKSDLPVVYTAHELKMICPNYKMMHDGRICEDCKGGHYYKCASNRCVMDSFSKSVISSAEAYFHRAKKSYDIVDAIITPSEFYRRKFIEFGVSSERLTAIPNFLDREKPNVNPSSDEKYFLYMGRLSEEKGVMTLLEAFCGLEEKLIIAGRGPLEEQVRSTIAEKNMQNVSYIGFVSGQEQVDLLGNAAALVIPSEWYENGPYSVIEALQLGVPVIGSDIGGIPELVDNNGFLFEPGNARELREKITSFSALPDEATAAMHRASENLFTSKYTAQAHYSRLIGVYESALQKH